MIDIGNVFRTAGRMMRQRFWGMLGLCAVFLAIQFGGFMVLGVGMVAVGTAGVAAFGAGLDDPSALAGMSIGLVAFMVLIYAAYVVLLLAQQAALVTLASPLEEPGFGAAMSRGFKSTLPFFAIAVLLFIPYFALAALVGGAANAGGLTPGSTAADLVPLLLLPVMVYLGCRFSVLVPVVAVDQVFNPVKAIRRSWQVTRGNVWRIFLSYVIFTLGAVLVLIMPFVLLFGLVDAGQDTNSGVADAGVAAIFLMFFPMLFLYFMSLSAYMAALHSEVTGGGAEALEEVFA
jgi:hypothetical protein